MITPEVNLEANQLKEARLIQDLRRANLKFGVLFLACNDITNQRVHDAIVDAEEIGQQLSEHYRQQPVNYPLPRNKSGEL